MHGLRLRERELFVKLREERGRCLWPRKDPSIQCLDSCSGAAQSNFISATASVRMFISSPSIELRVQLAYEGTSDQASGSEAFVDMASYSSQSYFLRFCRRAGTLFNIDQQRLRRARATWVLGRHQPLVRSS